jgi:hypothetical protein
MSTPETITPAQRDRPLDCPKEVPIPRWNESYHQTASAAASGNG